MSEPTAVLTAELAADPTKLIEGMRTGAQATGAWASETMRKMETVQASFGRVNFSVATDKLRIEKLKMVELLNQLDVARAAGDAAAVLGLERQIAMLQKLQQLQRAGLKPQQASEAATAHFSGLDEAKQAADARAAAELAAENRVAEARRAEALKQIELEHQLSVARAAGDAKTVHDLEQELALTQRIHTLSAAGVAAPEAEVMARRHLGELSAAAAGAVGGFNRMQLMELTHVARSLFDAMAAGISPMQAVAYEGGRIAQIFSEGTGGVGGTFRALAGLLGGPIALVALLTGALAGLVAMEEKYAAEQRQLAVSLQTGGGAQSGATIADLNAVADAAVKAGEGTHSFAVKAEEAFVRAGVAKDSLGPAIAVVRDFAALTGEKAPDALKKLAAAFADPADGAKQLRDAGVDLSNAELDNIRLTEEQSGKAAALAQLLRDLKGATAGAADELENGLGKALRGLGGILDDVLTRMGQTLYQLTHNIPAAEQIAQLQAANKADSPDPLMAALHAPQINERNRQIAALQPKADADAKVAKARASKAAGDDNAHLLGEVDPIPGQILELQAKRKRLSDAITAYRGGNKDALGDQSVADFEHGIATIDKNIHSLQTRGQKKPRKGPADQTDSLDKSARDAADTGDKELATAKAALTQNIQARADAELQGLKDETDKKLLALAEQERKVRQAKNDAHKTSQLALLEQAKADVAAAASAKREKINRDAQVQIDEAALQIQQTLDGYQDQILTAQEQIATSSKQRAELALRVARDEQVHAYETRRETDQAAVTDHRMTQQQADQDLAGMRAGQSADTVARNVAQQRSINPLYAKAHPTTTVGEDLQGIEAKGLSGVTDALTTIVTQSGNAKQAFSSLIDGMIADLARLAIQRVIEAPLANMLFGASPTNNLGNLTNTGGSVSIAGGLASGVGGLFSGLMNFGRPSGQPDSSTSLASSVDSFVLPHFTSLLGIPGFATGTDSTPGGLTRYNEQGTEGYVPPGAQIIPNATLRGLAQLTPDKLGGGGTVIVQGPQYHLQSPVVTQDLVDQMHQISAVHAAGVLATSRSDMRRQALSAGRNLTRF